ncbi:hypothetical protein A8M32_20875 [Sinorhizobium alkalisoli]|uniref:Uncharacterized protein n=1 Tax=Sinorhizobium alkalisoli TaxID=1752398 RepID=A0A1E3V758_9HYPH|nr:hypothetical protein A8M32_20875 [Sinorhizobium alkalisoli]
MRHSAERRGGGFYGCIGVVKVVVADRPDPIWLVWSAASKRRLYAHRILRLRKGRRARDGGTAGITTQTQDTSNRVVASCNVSLFYRWKGWLYCMSP